MSKVINIPTTEKECKEWANNIIKMAQKRGIRIYELMYYSVFMGKAFANSALFLEKDEEPTYSESLVLVCERWYNTLAARYNEATARKYFEDLLQVVQDNYAEVMKK